MNDSTFQDLLELEVSNFGPVVEAKIDLRPLTVFVGPSNTGKSYLAILIYALHRIFSEYRAPYGIQNRLIRVNLERDRALSPEIMNEVIEWAQQTLENKEMANRSPVLPDLVMDEIRFLLDARGSQFETEIRRCFAMDSTRALIRKGNPFAEILFRRKGSNDLVMQFDQIITLNHEETKSGTTIPSKMAVRIDAKHGLLDRLRQTIEGHRGGIDRNLTFWELTGVLTDFALPILGGPLFRPAFYLPADRTGVMHAHSVVVRAMIGSAPMAGLRPVTDFPLLSGVLADFLQQLIEIDRPPPLHRQQSRGDLGRQIEDAILDGSVRVDRSETIGYPHFTYQPTGWKKPLPLMNASSMVSELAPVVLYLRHVVQPGETLIIEEPESHLHPAMQVEFTRRIAELVQTGVRVIVTTHSEWVLEELANIVQRSKVPADRRKKIPRGEFALDPRQVGAWLFEPKSRPRGSVVKEIRLDDSGLFNPSEFDEVARVLHNDRAEIFSRIRDAEL